MPPPGVRSVREAGFGVNGKRKGIGESPGFGFAIDEVCVAGSGDEVAGRGRSWDANAAFSGTELGMLDVKGTDEDDVPRREESCRVVASFEGSWASSGCTAMGPDMASQPSASTPGPPIEVSGLCITPSTALSPWLSGILAVPTVDGLGPSVETRVAFPAGEERAAFRAELLAPLPVPKSVIGPNG